MGWLLDLWVTQFSTEGVRFVEVRARQRALRERVEGSTTLLGPLHSAPYHKT